MQHQVYLGLGSNLGEKEENIQRAIALIGEQIGVVERQSALYYSEPWGFESQNQFVNAVILVSTTLSPTRLLSATQRIERQLGKTKAHATERSLIDNSQLTIDNSPLDLQSPATVGTQESSIFNLPLDLQSPATAGTQESSISNSPLDLQSPATAGTQESSIFNLQSSIYKDRPIDIDILLYDDLHIDTPTLKIPHPLMQERDFVMIPLREICLTYADPEPSR